MFDWMTIIYSQEHCENRLREAAIERLARQALAERERCIHFYCRTMRWLGQQLIVWGTGLQERFGAPRAALTLQAARRSP